MKQTTLEEQFKGIEWHNHVWQLVEYYHAITCKDAWLLCNNYKTLKELPSCEELNLGIPHTYPSLTLKEDLGIQCMIARQNFRGVIANKPVNTFSIEIGNEPFLSTDETPPLKHINLSREELTKQANELYEKSNQNINK